jgi:D-3-phosphoglycerate dehydrogenase / 2-oxoglutarate reductase
LFRCPHKLSNIAAACDDVKTAWMKAEKATVLVTPRSFGRGDPTLRAKLEHSVARVHYLADATLDGDAERLADLLPDVDGWIAGLDIISSDVLKSAPRLRVIARYGVGFDQIDLAAARDRGIVVTNTPGANTDAVAEFTIALILALARQIAWADRSIRSSAWPTIDGQELGDSTLCLVGLGAVGKGVARRAAAFGCNIVATDPAADKQFAHDHQIGLLELDEALEAADFVSLHLPLTPETNQIVDEHFLARLRPGSYLINTARGALVDDNALIDALNSGRLAGAALDVHQMEPLPPEHPLRNRENVLLTPHTAAHTQRAYANMGRMAMRDCLAVLNGDQPLHPVPIMDSST